MEKLIEGARGLVEEVTGMTRKRLGDYVFAARWMLYPINVGLLIALAAYVGAFLANDYLFIAHELTLDLEHLMVLLLGFVDASMVANLIIVIVQGSHQIFIHKFEPRDHEETPQYLDHIDSGILKVKVALSISGITLVQILKDFVNLEHVDWELAVHRMAIHAMCLGSTLAMALIWRITHPSHTHKEKTHA
jgi:uncharacterized protein (TIGR00645 family)